MKRVVLLVVTVCLTVFVFAQEQNAGEMVEKANAAVENKEYAKAVELFESVLAIPDHGQNEENIKKVLDQLKPVVAKDNAKAAIDAKDYTKAVELYKAAIADFPNDASIGEIAGKMFYNEGILSYKAAKFLDAVKCFTTAEKEFAYEKAGKYKNASLKKIAQELAKEGKTSVDEVEVSAENKELLKGSLAGVYVSDGNDLYKKGAEILSAANQKVNDGAMTTADDAYTAEVAKAKKEFTAAIKILEKAAALDPSNANAAKLLEACKAVL